jgi:6-pyruvoyltetrahydropterin/6-carboxytetrahydropterin synthase
MMGHYLLSAEADFSAAHRLLGVDKCDQLHGHNWRIRLTVRVAEAAIGPEGMGVDFRDIEQTASSVVADFDHAYLNDLEAFCGAAPTAERLARIVYERAAARLSELAPAARVDQVEAWETPQYRVVYRPE